MIYKMSDKEIDDFYNSLEVGCLFYFRNEDPNLVLLIKKEIIPLSFIDKESECRYGLMFLPGWKNKHQNRILAKNSFLYLKRNLVKAK